MRKVPELNLQDYIAGSDKEKNQFSQNLFDGLKDYGFIVLTEHNLTQSLMDTAYQKVKTFFELPTETKLKFSGSHGGQRGFTAFGTEHAKNNPFPDLKEFWHVGPLPEHAGRFREFYPENIWPNDIAGFQETLSVLYSQLRESALLILEALTGPLGVEKDFFGKMVREGNSILRPIYYPPLEKQMPKGSVRAAAHEDINLITILMGATSSGLELLDRDGAWLPVETRPGELVIDTGDMMARITNEVLPATTHRVVNPELSSEARFSMPYFVHAHPEVELSCIPSCRGEKEKFAPINANDFFVQRLKEIGLLKDQPQTDATR